LACLSGALYSQTPSPPPPPQSEAVSLQEMDYQIQLVKQYIAEYNNQAFLFDEKAQSLLSHDFLGYRNAEAMSGRCKAIADDLTNHLSQLEKQRAEMAQRDSQKQAPASK
jgi:hypothetical protein